MTRIALPEMRKAGYDPGLAAGALAAGGSLGILIPPSIILVIYAAIAEQSVPRLFAAGLVPGLVLTALYMIVVDDRRAMLRKDYAPAGESVTWRERLAAMRDPWQFLVLFIGTIGGIYAGVFSPTEAASVGAAGAIAARRHRAAAHPGRRSCTRSRTPSAPAACCSSSSSAPTCSRPSWCRRICRTRWPRARKRCNLSGPMVMVLIIVAYIFFGCFLEAIGMMLITVPVFLPLVTHFGYDPVWFGVIIVIVAEVGLIHPPMGLNLFVIQAHAPDIRIGKIYRGIVPFLFAPLALIILMFWFPQIALWLPKLFYGGG